MSNKKSLIRRFLSLPITAPPRPPASPQEEKMREETKKLKIDNEMKLKTLIESRLFDGAMREIAHGIQTSFIDLPLREAPSFAALLGIPEKEAAVRIRLEELIQGGVQALKNQIKELTIENLL